MKTKLSSQRGIAAAALLVILALGGLAFFHGKNSPQAVLDGVYAHRDAGWEVKLDTPNQLVIGRDSAKITLHTARSGNLYLFQAGTDGKSLDLIFPNALDSNNLVSAGDTTLPRSNWRLDAAGPAGTGGLLAVITPKPVAEVAMKDALAKQQIPDLGAGYGAARSIWTEINP